MHRYLKSLLLGGCALGGISTVFAAQTVFTNPVVPPGTARTAVAAPRLDWLKHVQDNFNKSKGKHFDLVFDGDSIAAGWNWQGRGQEVWDAHYARLNAFDFGIAGDQVQNVLWRLQHGQLDGIDPKLIVLFIGENNVFIGKNAPSQIAEGIKVLLDEYLKDAPDAKILLVSCLPAKSDSLTDPSRAAIAQVDALLPSLADGNRVTYLDIAPLFLNPDGSMRLDMFVADRVHPTTKGYQAWADAMQPDLEKLLPSAAGSATSAPAAGP